MGEKLRTNSAKSEDNKNGVSQSNTDRRVLKHSSEEIDDVVAKLKEVHGFTDPVKAKDSGKVNDAHFSIEFADNNNNVINVPVYMDEHGRVNRVVVDVNKISTVFGRDAFRDYINRQIKTKNLVRIKNRSIQTSEGNALIAERYGMDTSKNSIPQKTDLSTHSAKKFLRGRRRVN